ncbi:hypothetical protein [Kosakonia sp. S42]|uniref:hypothetical protein n=1 Tax=Kosakonia sp. S42 TaxID=2767458 RepID=UPI0035C7AFCC
MAALLRRSAIQDILVVDSHEVGASFMRCRKKPVLLLLLFFFQSVWITRSELCDP